MPPSNYPPPAARPSAADAETLSALCRETDLSALLFEFPGVSLAIFDGAGRMTAVNSAGSVSLNIQDDDATRGCFWPDPWPNAARSEAVRALLNAFAGACDTFSVIFGAGTEASRAFLVDVRPLRGNAGNVVAALAAWRDTPTPASVDSANASREREAQIRAAAERQRTAQEALARAGRVQAQGELISTIAHDLNNVLASAASALRIMARSPNGQRDADIANRGHEAIDRGVRLVRQMLDFAPSVEAQPAMVDVAELLLGLEPVVRSIVGAAVRVSYDLAEDLWPTVLVAARLESVTLNLAANARDVMPGGGALHVAGRNVAPSACPEGLVAGEYICLDFIESGEGAAFEAVESAPTPFFATRDSGRSAGLGLASAFKLADDAGGRCFVASLPGRGALLSLYLPRIRQAAKESSAPAHEDLSVRPAKAELQGPPHVAPSGLPLTRE